MKVIALQNFKANGVKGIPGMELTAEQIETILPLKDFLLKERLIQIEEGAPAAEEPSGNEGIIDLGPDADDKDEGEDLAGSNEEEEKPVEAPKPAPKSKKKK